MYFNLLPLPVSGMQCQEYGIPLRHAADVEVSADEEVRDEVVHNLPLLTTIPTPQVKI